jgi:hypothetical protein
MGRASDFANVRAEYEKRKAEWVMPNVAVDVDDVVHEAAILAFSDPTAIFDDQGQLLPVTRWPMRARRSISSIEVVTKKGQGGEDAHRVTRVRFHDKGRALELLARHLGMLIVRQEIGGPGAFASLSDDELAERIHRASTRLATLQLPVKDRQTGD